MTGTALSGTAADAGVASANPGQAVTLSGSGLSTSTGVILAYTNSNGTAQTVLLRPSAAAADGTSATLIVPLYANGVATLSVLGAATRPRLQIVPLLTSYNVSGSTLQLFGAGLVEGASSYTLGGATVSDTAVNAGPDVFSASNPTLNQFADNVAVNISGAPFGLGTATVITAGGTSAPLAFNVFNPAVSTLGDVAADPATGSVWVSDFNNPAKLDLVNPSTGQVASSITLTSAFGSTGLFNLAGLQVLSAAISLGGTPAPSGSLLVFNGNASPDRVVAVNPSTGAVVASLALANNYDLAAGTYDPTSGHLFVVDRRTSPTKVVEINPATAAEISSFALPFNASSYAGLVVDPAGGTLWYGSDQSGAAVQLSRTGAVLRTVSLTAQGVPANTTSGLSFDAAGNLLVASNQGQVFRVKV